MTFFVLHLRSTWSLLLRRSSIPLGIARSRIASSKPQLALHLAFKPRSRFRMRWFTVLIQHHRVLRVFWPWPAVVIFPTGSLGAPYTCSCCFTERSRGFWLYSVSGQAKRGSSVTKHVKIIEVAGTSCADTMPAVSRLLQVLGASLIGAIIGFHDFYSYATWSCWCSRGCFPASTRPRLPVLLAAFAIVPTQRRKNGEAREQQLLSF